MNNTNNLWSLNKNTDTLYNKYLALLQSSVLLRHHHLALYSVDDMMTGENDWQKIEKEVVIV